ncbi:hypothetical protein TNCV_2476511 [Trichonephila clavipes]|nr:hypothetical protein TNCV_2476511 [Trichonephila clavipes]
MRWLEEQLGKCCLPHIQSEVQSNISAKFDITKIYKKYFRSAVATATINKMWRVLLKPECVSDSPRVSAVTQFRLLTGHDCLYANLFCVNLTALTLCDYVNLNKDLELEVNEDDIEELIMGHEDKLTIELQEILNEEHQKTQRNVSPSEQEEDER